LINTLLRHRHLFKMQLRPDVFDENSSILEFRAGAERMSKALARLPEGITAVSAPTGAISAAWLTVPDSPEAAVVLYMHGGGYVSGKVANHRAIVAKLVKQHRLRTLLFDYRLAPEHPYPAALEDSVAAYRWLLGEGYAPENIALMGDSAGGGLTLATLLGLRARGLPLPGAAVALSPWTDLTCAGESYRSKARVCLSPQGSWTAFSAAYAGNTDPAHPEISPLHGDLHGLPPLLLIAGEDEVLRDDAIAFAEKARAAGTAVSLRIEPGMVHCYPLLAPLFPEAETAVAQVSAFLHKHLPTAG
jgi:monoterpene epsilon-lactone hydrolase